MSENNKKKSYISGKESRKISAFNKKIMRKLEKRRLSNNVHPETYKTTMRDPGNVLELDNICTFFFTDIGTVKAVDGISFDIPKNSTVGVVGESGCGKSVTSLSVMQLLPRPVGQVVGGEIRFNSGNGEAYNIVNVPNSEMMHLRGNKISMIFQEPMTSLNPVFRIGSQVDEVIMLHNPSLSKAEVKKKTIDILKQVGIANAEGVYKMFPHELSGGMRQRVMIAMALVCNPELIIADEPTTALDVTIQAQILDLLEELKDKINSSIMLITHDLGVIAHMADYVVVMYAGRIVEKGTNEDIFHNPMHPYTIGLMKSKPSINKKVDSLYYIRGSVPNPVNMPNYCYFKDRCDHCVANCDGKYPPVIKVSDTHYVSCWRYAEEGEIVEYPKTVDPEVLLNELK